MASDLPLVGRLGVKIMPETGEFKGRLYRDLKRIENSVKAIEVGITLDAAGLTEHAKAAREAAQRAMQDLTLKVNVDDAGSLKSALANVRRELVRLGEIDLHVDLDRDSLTAAEALLAERLDQIADIKLRIDEGSTASLKRAIGQIDAELERLREIELGVKLNEAELTAAREMLQADLDATATITIQVDESAADSLKRALATVDAEIARRREIQVDVSLNDEDLEITRALLAERLADVAEVKLSVDTSSTASVKRALATVTGELEKFAEIEIGVNLNQGDLEAARELLTERLAETASLDIRVDRSSADSLRRAVEQIDAELGRVRETELHINLASGDLAAVRAELERQIAWVTPTAAIRLSVDHSSEESLKRELARLDAEIAGRRETAIAVTLDDASLATARQRLQQALDVQAHAKLDAARVELTALRVEVARNPVVVPVGAKADDASIRRATRQIETHLEAIQRLRATITWEMDPLSRRHAERQIEDLQDKIKDLRGEIKPDVSQPWAAKVTATLMYLARPRSVDFKPNVSQVAMSKVVAAFAALSGARVAGDWVKSLGESLMRLDRSAPIIGTIAAAIAGVGAWALSAASNLASLSASLASIAPAALVIPGILAGAAIAGGVLAAAFKDFGTVLPDVKSAFSSLQNTISTAFWAQAAAPIREMATTLLPGFRAGLQQTATQLGGLFGDLAVHLGTALGPALPGMFADLSSSIDIARGGTSALANIIAILGQVGAGYLPKLSAWFVDLGVRFSEFLTGASEDGRLKTWIDTAMTALSDLGRVLGGVGKTLLAIGTAATAAGGTQLATLADAINAIGDALNSTTGQAHLIGVLSAAHDAMNRISSIAGPSVIAFFESLSTAVQAILPVVGDTLGTALAAVATGLKSLVDSGGLQALFAGLQSGVSALAPALGPVGAALGSLGPIIGSLLAALGPLLGAILGDGGLSTALGSLTGPVNALIAPLGSALLTALQAVMPLVAQLAALAGGLLTAVLPLAVALLDLGVSIIQPLAEMIMGIVSEAMPGLQEAFSQLSASAQPLIEMLGVIASTLIDVLGPAIGVLVGGALDGLIIALSGLGQVFEGAFGVIMGIWNAWSAIFRGDWDAAWEGVKQAWAGLWSAVLGLLQVSLGFILGGLKKGLGLAVDVVVWAAQKWWEIFSGFWSMIGGFIAGCWTDAVEAISTGVGNAVTWVRKLPEKAKEALVNIGTALLEAGKSLIQGFIDGLTSMFGTVKDKLSGLTDSLTSWKGPPSRDATLLTGAGRLIIDGLIIGMESRYGAVRQSLRGLTSDIAALDPVSPGIATGRLPGQFDAALSGGGRVFNYYAAPGNSLSSEEELFDAVGRSRMVGW
ncbi:hypothetical protein Afil01_62190 [Actinorhabdospora filicis]|uniref:Phage-related protein n=1 Tax=Actinorhabdospora filicis TaxID=1785913 RepID=A0A9W6W6D4_9ACTN|nr:hypothetical protein [Actinorhabdospora filicis]GLZ81412.1 hypothetical protein Afil01_62190 [Actinorhabdospora filicis]